MSDQKMKGTHSLSPPPIYNPSFSTESFRGHFINIHKISCHKNKNRNCKIYYLTNYNNSIIKIITLQRVNQHYGKNANTSNTLPIYILLITHIYFFPLCNSLATRAFSSTFIPKFHILTIYTIV